MDKVKADFERKEEENRKTFENFVLKNKDNEFVTNLTIARMRMYHYKEMLKLFALNYKSEHFADSRNSVYAFLLVPSLTTLAFNIYSPFSIFRQIAIVSSFGGTLGSFVFSWKEELSELAKSDDTILGAQIRYRYSQLAAYDNLQMSYKD